MSHSPFRRAETPRTRRSFAACPVGHAHAVSRGPDEATGEDVWRLALSQTPNHDPADQPVPDWADTWMREYDLGTDMTRFSAATGRPQKGSGIADNELRRPGPRR